MDVHSLNHGIKRVLYNHPEPWDTETMIEQLSGKQCEYPIYCNIELSAHTHTRSHTHIHAIALNKFVKCVSGREKIFFLFKGITNYVCVGVSACMCMCM